MSQSPSSASASPAPSDAGARGGEAKGQQQQPELKEEKSKWLSVSREFKEKFKIDAEEVKSLHEFARYLQSAGCWFEDDDKITPVMRRFQHKRVIIGSLHAKFDMLQFLRGFGAMIHGDDHDGGLMVFEVAAALANLADYAQYCWCVNQSAVRELLVISEEIVRDGFDPESDQSYLMCNDVTIILDQIYWTKNAPITHAVVEHEQSWNLLRGIYRLMDSPKTRGGPSIIEEEEKKCLGAARGMFEAVMTCTPPRTKGFLKERWQQLEAELVILRKPDPEHTVFKQIASRGRARDLARAMVSVIDANWYSPQLAKQLADKAQKKAEIAVKAAQFASKRYAELCAESDPKRVKKSPE